MALDDAAGILEVAGLTRICALFEEALPVHFVLNLRDKFLSCGHVVFRFLEAQIIFEMFMNIISRLNPYLVLDLVRVAQSGVR